MVTLLCDPRRQRIPFRSTSSGSWPTGRFRLPQRASTQIFCRDAPNHHMCNLYSLAHSPGWRPSFFASFQSHLLQVASQEALSKIFSSRFGSKTLLFAQPFLHTETHQLLFSASLRLNIYKSFGNRIAKSVPAHKSDRRCRATKHCLRTRFLRESGNHS